MISDRLKFLFSVLCSLFLLLCGASQSRFMLTLNADFHRQSRSHDQILMLNINFYHLIYFDTENERRR